LILRALEQAGGGDTALGVEAVSGEIENEMAAGEVGPEAQAGLAHQFDQIMKRQALNIVEEKRWRRLLLGEGFCGGHGGFNHGGHGMEDTSGCGFSRGDQAHANPAPDSKASDQFFFGGK
jgi:hypothetical protein